MGNASVQNWVAMLFVTLGRNWSNSLAESVTSWLVQIILLATTIMATRSATADEDREWREFCLWIVAMVMLSPVSWVHYQVLLLIPYIQLTIGYNRGGTNYRAIGMEIVSYCLTLLYFFAQSRLVLLQSMVLLTAYVGAYWATREAA